MTQLTRSNVEKEKRFYIKIGDFQVFLVETVWSVYLLSFQAKLSVSSMPRKWSAFRESNKHARVFRYLETRFFAT